MTEATSLLLYGPRDLRWTVEELPSVAEGRVLLETIAGAVSVGTELPLYRGDAREVEPGTYPRMTGYESLAWVREVGTDGTKHPELSLGQRVVATYGHRSAACLPSANLISVPDDIPDEIALLSILSTDVRKGIEKLRFSTGSRILMTGGGTIGLLTLHWLRVLGCQHIDVIEPLDERRALALELGANAAYGPEDTPSGASYEAGFECSSAQAAFSLLQRKLLPHGQLCVLSDGNNEPFVLEPEFHSQELSLIASSDGEDYPGHARAFFEAWRQTRAPLEKLFTWRVSAGDLPRTFERMLYEQPPLKILVTYPS